MRPGAVVLYLGIDVGSLTAQAVLVDGDGAMVGQRSIRALTSPEQSAEAAAGELVRARGAGRPVRAVATGYGRQRLQQRGVVHDQISEITCHGLGAYWLDRRVRTVIDIGGQDAKVIRVDDRGELVDFVMNDKCASGTGRFLEVMSRTLEVPLEELGQLALGARGAVELSARCSIFCETEVLHHLQRGADRAELAASIARAMAERVAALARRVDLTPEVTMTGGVAHNKAVVREVERLVGLRFVPCPRDPQIVGALGAALVARREAGG